MSIKDDFLKVFSKMCKDSWKKAPFDRTYSGRIKEKLTENNYKISINGNEFIAKAIDTNRTYNTNELVYILAPQSNYKKLLIL